MGSLILHCLYPALVNKLLLGRDVCPTLLSFQPCLLPSLGTSATMFKFLSLLTCLGAVIVASGQGCPDYSDYSKGYHPPFSTGHYNLSYQRPSEACRTFTSQAVEDTITRLNSTMADPDLFRLFQNSYPNTLDTAIKWKGTAAGSDEELTFVITGDMYTKDRLAPKG